jgi:hypothetical protein
MNSQTFINNNLGMYGFLGIPISKLEMTKHVPDCFHNCLRLTLTLLRYTLIVFQLCTMSEKPNDLLVKIYTKGVKIKYNEKNYCIEGNQTGEECAKLLTKN